MKLLTTVFIFLIGALTVCSIDSQAAEFRLGHTYLNPTESVQYRVESDGKFYHSPGGPYIGRIDKEGRVYNRKGAFINRIKLRVPEFTGPTFVSNESGQFICL